jgi:WD40 repeat protein
MGKDGSVKSWDLATGKISKQLPAAGRHARRITASDGSYFLSTSTGEMKVRALDANGKERYAVQSGLGGLGALAISPDGSAIVAASYDADVRAWNARNGELLRLIDELPVSMFDLKFSPDGRWLAAAGADRIVYIYDTKTWKIARRFIGQPEMISALAFSADGSKLASGGFSVITLKKPVKVLIWDVSSGQTVRTFNAPQRVTSIAFSPDGRLAAASTSTKVIDIWQVAG